MVGELSLAPKKTMLNHDEFCKLYEDLSEMKLPTLEVKANEMYLHAQDIHNREEEELNECKRLGILDFIDQLDENNCVTPQELEEDLLRRLKGEQPLLQYSIVVEDDQKQEEELHNEVVVNSNSDNVDNNSNNMNDE